MGRLKIRKEGKKRRAFFFQKKEKQPGCLKIRKKEGLLIFKNSKLSIANKHFPPGI